VSAQKFNSIQQTFIELIGGIKSLFDPCEFFMASLKQAYEYVHLSIHLPTPCSGKAGKPTTSLKTPPTLSHSP
jgi:hypothetical protein